jgi:hypothetical protein
VNRYRSQAVLPIAAVDDGLWSDSGYLRGVREITPRQAFNATTVEQSDTLE